MVETMIKACIVCSASLTFSQCNAIRKHFLLTMLSLGMDKRCSNKEDHGIGFNESQTALLLVTRLQLGNQLNGMLKFSPGLITWS